MSAPETDMSIECYETLIRVARRITRDTHRGEDLAHESWMLALAKGRTVTQDLPWIIGVMKMIHRQTARREASRRVREIVAVHGSSVPTAEPYGAVGSTDTMYAAVETPLVQVEAALDRLDPVQAETIRMRYLEERSCHSIAAQSGVPVETVRTRIKRGVTQLRALLVGAKECCPSEPVEIPS